MCIKDSIQTPEADLALCDGSTEIDATSGTVDFGLAQLGASVDKTFTIKNIGTADLLLPHSLSLPSGYRMVSLASTDIAPGGSASLVLELVGGSRGTYSGAASINTNMPG